MEKSAFLPVSIEQLDMEMASRVAQTAVLEEIFLVEAKISRDQSTVSAETLFLEHKCDTEIPSHDKEEKNWLILCNFQVSAFNGKSPDKLVMKIEASFCTSYAWKLTDPHIRDDDSPDVYHDKTARAVAEYLFRINPISHAWPYWREFVQSMSTRMGFPALTVPLLEIVPKKSSEKEEKRQRAKRKPTQRKKVIS